MSVKGGGGNECLQYIHMHASLGAERPSTNTRMWVHVGEKTKPERQLSRSHVMIIQDLFPGEIQTKTQSVAPACVVIMRTLICAHDCRRHLIYKPHLKKRNETKQKQKVAIIIITAQ